MSGGTALAKCIGYPAEGHTPACIRRWGCRLPRKQRRNRPGIGGPRTVPDPIHLSPARYGGEPYAGVPRGREHPLGQGRGESPAREAPVSSRAEGRSSTRLYLGADTRDNKSVKPL